MEYNSYQQEAIDHGKGPCLVLAGPGSGKTAVVTARIRKLMERGVEASHILVITFTRAAAAEMKERFLRESGEGEGVTFGTFHSVFFQILRLEQGYSMENVLKEKEQVRLLSEVLGKHFPEYPADPEYLSELLTRISNVKNRTEPLLREGPAQERIDFRKLFRWYENARGSLRKIDYDDMLSLTEQLLRERPDILRKWQEKYRYIMVDEFQDINRVQYEVIRLLALPENNLFVVGDDDQSIYGFRGSDPGIMLSFPKDYRGAARRTLLVNYRSGRRIVELSLNLIGHNRERFRKKLRAGSETSGEVILRTFRSDREECECIADEILELQKTGTELHKIAVLLRTNRGAESLLQVFTDRSVPFFTRDRVPNLFRHFACVPLFALLNYAIGSRSRENFLKFMNCPVRGIRRTDLTEEAVDLRKLREKYEGEEDRRWLSKTVEDLEKRLQVLASLKMPYAMINYARKGMGLDEYFSEKARKDHRDPGEATEVLDRVQESAAPYSSVAAWYRHIADYTRELQEGAERGALSGTGKVTVSTIHGAKGLEFRRVYIPDVNERVIPHEKSVTEKEIEEERRLLYVGMTRAAESLRLYSVQERFGKKTEASRFLREIR